MQARRKKRKQEGRKHQLNKSDEIFSPNQRKATRIAQLLECRGTGNCLKERKRNTPDDDFTEGILWVCGLLLLISHSDTPNLVPRSYLCVVNVWPWRSGYETRCPQQSTQISMATSKANSMPRAFRSSLQLHALTQLECKTYQPCQTPNVTSRRMCSPKYRGPVLT